MHRTSDLAHPLRAPRGRADGSYQEVGMLRIAGTMLSALAAVAAIVGCGTSATATPSSSVVSATLSATSTASPTPSPSPTATPPAEEDIDAEAFFDVAPDGYQLIGLPRSVEEQARSQLEGQPGVKRYVTDMALRSVALAGDRESIGIAMAVGIRPSFASLPGIEQGFAQGMAGEAGVEAKRIEIGGETAFIVGTQQQVVVSWQEQNLLIAVFAASRDETVAIAEALLAR